MLLAICVYQSLTRILKNRVSCIRVLAGYVLVYLLKIFIFRVCIVYFANFLIVYSRVFNTNKNYSIFIFHVLFILKEYMFIISA